jgi:hypothetical protein
MIYFNFQPYVEDMDTIYFDFQSYVEDMDETYLSDPEESRSVMLYPSTDTHPFEGAVVRLRSTIVNLTPEGEDSVRVEVHAPAGVTVLQWDSSAAVRFLDRVLWEGTAS